MFAIGVNLFGLAAASVEPAQHPVDDRRVGARFGPRRDDGIPASWNLGFAGTMALLALTCTQLRQPVTWAAAIVAACAAVAAYALPLKLNIIVAIAAGSGACYRIDGSLGTGLLVATAVAASRM